jgi:GntR family transcriptional regulator, arabinose operon transcriptional repressor
MGIIYPPKLDDFGTELIHRLHHEAERRGFSLAIRTVSDFGTVARQTAQDFIRQGCFALFLPLLPCTVAPEELWELVRPLPVPVVLSRPVPGLEQYCYERKEVFGTATYEAVEMACRYFKTLGFGNIAFFGADYREEEDFQRRLLAYSRFASREGLDTHIGLVGPRALEVDQIVARWSALASDLAVVCCGDEDALRLMTALHKQNLRIPQDVAVLGFKNIALAATSDPPLSTIQFDYDYVARAMLDHAEALRQGTSAQADGRARQRLVIRESCGGRLRRGDALPAIIEQVQTVDATDDPNR